MNWSAIAAELVQMTAAQQRAYLSRLNPAQLVAVYAAARRLQERAGMQGLGELGLNFGSLLRNIGGALLPFAGMIPGIGPIVAAVGGAALSTFAPSQSSSPPPPPQPPPPPPAPASGGISPIALLAGAAVLIAFLKR